MPDCYISSETENNNFDYEFSVCEQFSDIQELDILNIQRDRISVDKTINNYGRKFLSFCKNNNVFILNGRIAGDRNGKATSRNTSVVDYTLCTANIMHRVNNFEVMDFSSLYSDIHSPLHLVVDIHKHYDLNERYEDMQTNYSDKIGHWDQNRLNEYRNNIDLNGVEELKLYTSILSKTDD